jgi:hypothetical protein
MAESAGDRNGLALQVVFHRYVLLGLCELNDACRVMRGAQSMQALRAIRRAGASTA